MNPQNTSQCNTKKQVFVVEASAGTGKTFALANEYLRLLKGQGEDQNPFRSILAITFTNKAAAEMKARIIRYLKEAGLKGDESASGLIDDLLRGYDYFQVRTIDSFVNSLISACSFRGGLTADFEVRHDTEDLLSYCLDDLIDSSADNKDLRQIFTVFLDNYIYTENKTSWFPRRDILNVLKAMYSDSNIYGMGFNKSGKGSEIIKLKKDIASLAQRLGGCDLKGINKNFVSSLEKFIKKTKEGFTVDDISDFFKRDEVPVNKGYEASDDVASLWTAIKKALSDLCEAEAFSTYDCYVDIYDLVMEEFEKASKTLDVMYLEELNKRALAIRGLMDAGELYWRLALRFRHYLFDEFQDTSFLQWNNLCPMIEEALSTGGTLFYVGDKKQSIYRFRGAAPVLFDRAKLQLGQFESSVKTLNMNFRSQKEIVDFNNRVFSAENLCAFISALSKDNENIEDLAADLLDLYKVPGQESLKENISGKIAVEAVDDADGKEAAEIIEQKVVSAVKDLRAGQGCSDIAVLCRDNDDVQAVSSWLLKESIPVESFLTLSIRENALIKEIISFLSFLISPVDNPAFASFMTGKIFLKSSGLEEKEVESFIMEWDRGKAHERYLYKEFIYKYPALWSDLIEDFFGSVEFVPLYEFIVRIISSFGCMENFSGQQGFFMKLLEVIKEKEEDILTVESFLKYFDATEDDLYVNASGAGAVKVMTVHRAKGLGFKAVILPLLRMDVKVAGRGRSGSVIEEDGKLSIVRLKEKYNNYSNRLKDIYRQEYMKSFIDELNNVYVALTRAKDILYVFVPPKSGSAVNLVRYLLPEKYEKGAVCACQEQKKDGDVILAAPSRYCDVTALLEADEHIKGSIVADRDKKVSGDMAHLALSFIGNLKGKEVQEEIDKALQAASLRYAVQDIEKVRTSVEKLIKNKRASSLFFLDEGDVYTEKEVITAEGSLYRIDRLIVKKDEVFIADYKSSKDNHTEYVSQLRNYLFIVKGIFGRSKIRGCLVYLDTGGVEEING